MREEGKKEEVPERSRDWITQAHRDLESAKAQARDGFYEWSCFIAQQAAEKALKGVYQKMGGDAWGHSIRDLLRGLPREIRVPDPLPQAAGSLDQFYVPSRYPNGWPSGTPGEFITEENARQAISHSQNIVGFCDDLLAR